MKLFIGIMIGLSLGFIIGGMVCESICGKMLKDGWNRTNICVANLRECQKDTSPDECDILIADYIDMLEESRNKCSILLDETRDSCNEYLDSCYERNDDWENIYDDLIDYRYNSDYNHNNDYPICSYNIYDCADFKTQAEAQTIMEYCGYDDVHYLDGDNDGIACETYFEKSNLNFGLLGEK